MRRLASRAVLLGLAAFLPNAPLIAQDASPSAPVAQDPPAPDPPPSPSPEPIVPVEPPPERAPPAAPPPPAAPATPVPAAPPTRIGRPALIAQPSAQGPDTEPERLPPEHTLSVEPLAGLSVRLDARDAIYEDRERADITFGAAVWYSPSRAVAVGLAFQRTGLGGDQTPAGEESFNVQRDLDTLWLSGRVYPIRRERTRLFAELDLGGSVQRLSANGTRPGDFVRPPSIYACSESAGPAPAVMLGGGVDVDVEPQLAFLASAGAAAHFTTSDVVDHCAPGAGTAVNALVRIGIAYRFDLD